MHTLPTQTFGKKFGTVILIMVIEKKFKLETRIVEQTVSQ